MSAFSPTAIYTFGKALHTVTDRTSPQHVGNTEWDGLDRVGPTRQMGRAAAHGIAEAYAGYRNHTARLNADLAARQAWVRFLKKLEEARKKAEEEKKKQEEEEKKKKKAS